MNIELIEELAEKIQDENCKSWNEAQTRTYLIDRMLEALGYIRADYKVWVVEDDADFRSQRGKKVDYSLFNQNRELVLIVEAKKFGVSLRGSTQQLSDYFSNKIKSENCKFIAMLSNGVEYQFFCDLDQENILDEKPFFTFNLKDYTSKDIEILKMFSYEKINGQKIWEWVRIFKTLENQIIKLDTEFISFVIKAASFPDIKRIQANTAQKYKPEIQKAFEYLIYKYDNKFDKSTDKKHHHTQKSDENLNSFTREKAQTYDEQYHLNGKSSKIIEMYEALRAEILNLGNITLKPTKNYIAFKDNKNIANLVFGKNKIKIYTNLKYTEIKDLNYKNKLRDVSNIHTWGNGEFVFTYGNIEDLDYLMSLIKESYKKNK